MMIWASHSEPEQLKSLLGPYACAMVAWPVSQRVVNVKTTMPFEIMATSMRRLYPQERPKRRRALPTSCPV